MAIVTPPKVLREKLGDDGVDALVELVNMSNEKQKEDVLVFVEEKFERRLTEVKTGLEEKIYEFKTDLEVKIAGVKSDLEVKIAETRSDLIKWMFIFWIGQIAVITGIIFAFTR